MADNEKQTAEGQQPPAEEQFDARKTLLEGQEGVEAPTEGAAPEQPAQQQQVPETPPGQPAEQTPEQPAEQPAAEGEPAPEAPAESAENTFLKAVQELGWQGESVEDAQQAVLDAFQRQAKDYTQLQQRLTEQEELARYGTQFLKEQREREEAETKSKQAQDEQKPEHWWTPPTFDPAQIERYRDVQLNEQGQPEITWKKDTPREVIDNAQAYQQYLDQWATDLVQRPQEILPNIIRQEVDSLLEERFSEREQAQTLESFATEVRQANADWMYTSDTQGNETLTPEGQQMTQLLAEVAEAGVSDPRKQWELAVARYDYLNRASQQQQQSTAEQASQTAAQRRKEHVDKGSRRPAPNRGGTVPRPEDSGEVQQNPNLTPGQQLVEQLKRDGAL